MKPKETVWERYYDGNETDNKLVYVVVSKDKYRDKYVLIDVSSGKRKEVASASDPLKLRSKMVKFKGGK